MCHDAYVSRAGMAVAAGRPYMPRYQSHVRAVKPAIATIAFSE
jgi:hypothetical protein